MVHKLSIKNCVIQSERPMHGLDRKVVDGRKRFRYDLRVGRVLSFFSIRRNWDSPNPLPRMRVCPPPPPVLGGGAHLLAREGLGES
jgi:hypothetical protein